MKLPPLLEIDQQAIEGARWELVTFGRLYPCPPGGSQHQIDVVFASIDDSKKPDGGIRVQLLRRGVNELPTFQPGSIWIDRNIDGEFLRQYSGENLWSEQTFEVRLPSPGKNSTQSLNEFFGERDSKRLSAVLKVLPDLPVIRFVSDSSRRRVIFIPPIEIFRASFCKDTDLTKMIFHAEIKSLLDHVKTCTFGNRQVVSVDPRLGVSDQDARILADIHSSPAIQEFAMRGAHTARSSVNARGVLVRNGSFLTGRSFWQGATRLLAYGRFLRSDHITSDEKGQNIQKADFGTFIQLIGDVDFERPYDAISNPKLPITRVDAGAGAGDRRPFPFPTGSSGGDRLDPYTGPQNDLVARRVVVDNPFVLEGKKTIEILRDPVDSFEQVPASSKYPVKRKVDALSSGASVGNDPGTRKMTASTKSPTADFYSTVLLELWKAACAIHTRQGWQIRSVLNGDPANETIAHEGSKAELCRLPTRVRGKRISWSIRTDGEDRFVRRALVVEFQRGDEYAYALDIERFVATDSICILVFAFEKQAKIDVRELNRLLHELAADEGIFRAPKFDNRMFARVRKLAHTSKRQNARDLAVELPRLLFPRVGG